MAIRSDLTVDWYVSPRIITVASPSLTITIQDLHDTIRDFEDYLPEGMQFNKLISSAGKEDLGGGTNVGITATLQNAKLAFEARLGPDFVQCTVSGGNLVAVNSAGSTMNPIYTTDFVQVVIAQSSSPTIATPESDYAALYLLESLKSTNRALGNIYYWNPESGNDTNNGLTPTNAVSTFAQAQTLASAGTGDIIFGMATATGGTTTATENLTITKNNLKVRGAGYSLQLSPSAAGNPTVDIQADNVELSGFYITTDNGGTDNGITITGDNAMIEGCWVNSATGNGIDLSSSARTTIDTCAIEDSTGNGINIGATTTVATIKQCILSGNVDGVDISGSGVTDNIFENNLIYNNSGYGIDVGSGVLRTGVRLNHTFSGNTSGNTRDLGTGTFIETTAGGASASEIADAVWDEVISGHVSSGTTGKTLKDAKTKATLASLK